MNRREFSALLPALLSAAALLPEAAEAQTPAPAADGSLPPLKSGVYPPSAPSGSPTGRSSKRLVAGMLPGNIRCEAHVSTIMPGTPHEAVGTHLHSEMWYVTAGTPTLMTNGVERLMQVGDMGICSAGDTHYIANYSKEPCTYFVITAGPPEPAPAKTKA